MIDSPGSENLDQQHKPVQPIQYGMDHPVPVFCLFQAACNASFIQHGNAANCRLFKKPAVQANCGKLKEKRKTIVIRPYLYGKGSRTNRIFSASDRTLIDGRKAVKHFLFLQKRILKKVTSIYFRYFCQHFYSSARVTETVSVAMACWKARSCSTSSMVGWYSRMRASICSRDSMSM